MGLFVMSEKELQRIKIIEDVQKKRISVVQAAKTIGVSRRQMTRLVAGFRKNGSLALISKKRGRPSNRTYSVGFRDYVIEIVRQHYHDFGPTLALEKLSELHEVPVSKETLRKWMIQAGIWNSRKEQRKQHIHQPRLRRECFGELIQIDGSHHRWFEDRSASRCALLVFIDDATSRLVHLRFCKTENAFDYFHAAKTYLKEYGKPLAFYSDKHAVFRTTHPSNKDATTGMTQFGRALNELNVDIICANSPQAKGRVKPQIKHYRTDSLKSYACGISVPLKMPMYFLLRLWLTSIKDLAKCRTIQKTCIALYPNTTVWMVPCATR